MRRLSSNWLTEGWMDFEYKKYLLLAYLQNVEKRFSDKKLFPELSDIIEHYRFLKTVQKSKENFSEKLPAHLKKVDWKNWQLTYEKMTEDEDWMKELESILEFALPNLQHEMQIGKELYDYVEDKLTIMPVDVIPLNVDFGYLLLLTTRGRTIRVYDYEITLFEHAREKYRSIRTSYVTSYYTSIINTFENIKLKLMKEKKEKVNPAVYAMECTEKLPYPETLLPVAKRSLVRYLYR
jgi:hypothetical protein